MIVANNGMFDSLFRMVEEYNRLVSPVIKQLAFNDRWEQIASPLLRVAELQHDVVLGVSKFDTTLASRLTEIAKPYQPMLDNMAAIENLMGTRFSELVRPQIYLPTLSSEIAAITSAESQIEKTAQITQPGKSVEDLTRAADRLINPWRTDLSIISALDTINISDTTFGQLVEAEKAVARLSPIIERYDQITSIAAQIASIQQIDLTDAWKQSVASLELLSGLSDFALKQYTAIQKSADNETISWRLDLIDAASRFVDAQVAWGAELAVENDNDVPEVEAVSPDFSELPVFLSYAKRDKIDVEKAFNSSSFVEITGVGKLIVQKAKTVNDFCIAHKRPPIFPKNNLLNWTMVLSGAFCRDKDGLTEVMETLYDMFVRKEIINLIGQQRCFDEIDKYRVTNETKKSKITKIQKQIYWQIVGIEDKIIATFGEAESFVDEDDVSSYMMRALLNVQKDKNYYGKDENTINDGIRNQLSMIYEVKDQTRQGVSASSKDAGEIDFMLYNGDYPVAIVEGLKLDGVNKDYLNTHIDKVLTNYDPIGCPLVYILIYATAIKFESFWDRIVDYLSGYSFPYDVVEAIHEISVAYTESRHAKAILKRSGKDVCVHLYAISMRQ